MANQANDRKEPGFDNIRNSAVEKRQKKRVLQKYITYGIILLFVMTLGMLVIFGIGAIASAVSDKDKGNNEKIDWNTITVSASDTQQGALVVVNNQYKYTFPATNEHLGKLADTLYANPDRPYQLSGLSTYMDQTALSALDSMLTDFANATGKKDVLLRYAYRSYDEQQANYENGSSTAPGYSDHHTGLSCELRYMTNGKQYELSADPTYGWIAENAHKYGFVQRYPLGKETLTGVSDYEGCYRYVGVAHATYMKENSLCLEEYIPILQGYSSNKPLTINGGDGKRYDVYYVAVSDGGASVKCPTNYAYTLSGTNMGGVVITVDRSRTVDQQDGSDTTDTQP